MKIKITLFIIFILLSSGCINNKDSNIHTLVEEKSNLVLAINYPITNIKKLDKLIKKDVSSFYNKFKDEYEYYHTLYNKYELNIDYTYEVINNRYISITLNIKINDENSIKTYFFDKKSSKFLTLNKIVKNIDNFNDKIKNALLNTKLYTIDEINNLLNNDYKYFSLNYKHLTIYFKSDEIEKIKIPISDIDLNILIDNTTFIEDEKITNISKFEVDPNKKVIALTFDDGPSKYTKEIVDYLNEEGAVATFFVLGNKVEIYKDTLKKMIENGNEIGNHSYNHKWLTKLSKEELNSQIEDTQNILYNILGYTPVSFRPTYGSINKTLRENTDLNIILWDIDTMDWKIKSSNTIANRAINKAYDGAVILMHDTYKRTLDALKIIVPKLKEEGYQFVTINQLQKLSLQMKK